MMGADTAVQVLMSGDAPGQVLNSRNSTVIDVHHGDTLRNLADKINHALSRFANVYVPLRVKSIKLDGDTMLLNVTKFQSVSAVHEEPRVTAPSSPVRPAAVPVSSPSFNLYMGIFSDDSGQLKVNSNLLVEDVNNNDTIAELENKINRAAAKVKGVNIPLMVTGIFYGGQNLLLGDKQRKLSSLGSGLAKESKVLIKFEAVTIKGSEDW